MTQQDVCSTIAEAAKLNETQAGKLVQATFEVIARELSAGEEVQVDGLGVFMTVTFDPIEKNTSSDEEEEHAAAGGLEPDFEPDPQLVAFIEKQIAANPELFAHPQEEGGEPSTSAKEEPLSISTPLQIKEEDLPDMPEGELAAEESLKEEEKADSPKKEEEVKQDSAEPTMRPSEEKPIGRASPIEFMDISKLRIEKDILAMVPYEVAKRYSVVPVDLTEGVLTLAMIDPEDFDALQLLRKETGLVIRPVLTSRDDLGLVLDQYTGLQAELQEAIESVGADFGITKKDLVEASQEDLQDQTNENAPTAKIVYSLLKRAVKERASDIHIEPYEGKVVVRFRIDGVLIAKVELPKEIQSAIISRLKILANLKIDEQRLPQDGRLSLIIDHRPIDFRLSTIPVVFGEKVVMRILDKSVGIISLEEVGLTDHGFEVLNKNIQRSHGMILVTGPTGSGKTTSLYAVLGKLMSATVNILTLEDPVEYRIESINQSQVHADIGYTFAAGLRAVVRQDPDIVMLGEIRDQETADMAIHAALTGHVVLSTLHTNDAAGAFPRLIDMKIEPFLITSSVHTVIGQRLARQICKECKEEYKASEEELKEVDAQIKRMPKNVQDSVPKDERKFYRGKGCDACGGKGYKGRAGVFEVLDVTEEIRDLVLKRSSGASITAVAIEQGMVTMIQDGIIKALRGLTTLEEVWRVTME